MFSTGFVSAFIFLLLYFVSSNAQTALCALGHFALGIIFMCDKTLRLQRACVVYLNFINQIRIASQPKSRCFMKKITIHYITGYALAFALCFIGLTVLVAVLWTAWPNVSTSYDILSALETYLWTKELDTGFGITLNLMHLTIIGAATLVSGITILAFSRQIFYEGESVLLQCPFCKNQWKANRARGWAKCPHCNQLIQPTVVKN